MPSDYPEPHLRLFGGLSRETELQWAGIYEFQPFSELKWKFTYVDQHDDPVEVLSARGRTLKEAFEGVVALFIKYNHGEESPTLKEILPSLRDCFNEDGGFKAEYFLAL